MRRGRMILLALAVLATIAGSAFAASSGTRTSASVGPNGGRADSSLKLSVAGLAAEKTLPSTFTLSLKGFSTGALGSAAGLCTALEQANNACPASSEVGTGTMSVSPKPGLFGQYGSSIPFTLTFYAGAPTASGCLASVAVVLSMVRTSSDAGVAWPNQRGIGKLCAAGGAVALSFPQFPTSSYYTSTAHTVTINKLTLNVGTRNGSSLWRNPSGCGGHWSGSLALGFGRRSVRTPFSVACR